MILLLGGTSETAEIATRLAEAGYEVLVSTATDVPLDIGEHPNVSRRSGRLTADGMAQLIREHRIRAVVDATHPYAYLARAASKQAADQANIPCLTYVRPGGVHDETVVIASNHEEAARIAFSFGRPVLLTTGSRNLTPYVKESQGTRLPLVVRVLDNTDSVQACRDAGIPADCIVTGRGPFSVEDNRSAIRGFGVGVLVTKDSGVPGGVEEKLEAARLEGCHVVVVGRPEQACEGAFTTVRELIEGVVLTLTKG